MEILSLIIVGIALSMDTFSLSLGIGMWSHDNKKALKLALIVGIMHFIMPFIGMLLGTELSKFLEINADILLGIILMLIAVQMFIDILKHEEEKFDLSIIGMMIFAVGVSLDSFSVGIGLKAITSNVYLGMTIFAICSFLFTFTGIIMGRFANKIMGVYANIIGVIILFILGLVHLL